MIEDGKIAPKPELTRGLESTSGAVRRGVQVGIRTRDEDCAFQDQEHLSKRCKAYEERLDNSLLGPKRRQMRVIKSKRQF